jgi:coiled-coil domain-containing protein 130
MQGFNMGRYVPPDLEGKVSFNQASGKGHALGHRASKLKSQGILIVRFECPFAIWCTTCNPEQIIGQGVRFNAEKRKVGNYYSTPIWAFRIKHTTCGGWIEVRTDPKNAEYVVTEGGRRRDTGADKILDGEIRIDGATEQEKEQLEKEGAFGALEKKVEDKKTFMTQQQRIDELVHASEKDWADPYELSRKLRRDFRVGRRKRQADAQSAGLLKDKYGLGVDLLEERDEDATKAKLVQYGVAGDVPAVSKPLFLTQQHHSSKSEIDRGKRGKSSSVTNASAQNQHMLQEQLRTKMYPSSDPFRQDAAPWNTSMKRKRSSERTFASSMPPAQQPSTSLVDYESD